MGLNFALRYMFNIWCDNVCFLAKSRCTTCNETKLVLKSMKPKGLHDEKYNKVVSNWLFSWSSKVH